MACHSCLRNGGIVLVRRLFPLVLLRRVFWCAAACRSESCNRPLPAKCQIHPCSGFFLSFVEISVAPSLPLLPHRLCFRFGLRVVRGRDPVWLYAASNAGSLGALVIYVIGVEPFMALESQGRWWHYGLLLWAGWLLAVAFTVANKAPEIDELVMSPSGPAPTRIKHWEWLFLGAVPSFFSWHRRAIWLPTWHRSPCSD